jgi:riboflavin kinase / FMN adenylyltransferase
MKVVTSLDDADVSHPSVVSIGNFDGLHLGHLEILKTVVNRARDLDLQSVAMTFSPHPIQFLAPERAPHLINTLSQKLELIENLGLDVAFVAPFDAPFSHLTPEQFVRRYLIDGLKARSICVGGNFNFGYRQRGSIATLREFGSHFQVIEVLPVIVRGQIVSSSRIRQHVQAGNVSRACRLLGRWMEIEGEIVSGAGRGRTVTVPTLNLKSENELIPASGVYITQIALDGGPFIRAVTNIGIRPTFHETDLTIETFVLEEKVPPEVRRARLRFLRRLRDERKFDSADQLKDQIALDVRRAQKFFRHIKAGRPRG